jgi:hypothetical protein
LSKEIELGLSDVKLSPSSASQSGSFNQRPLTKSGGRHCQESSFSFSGEQWDDQIKSASRVKQPPGGRSNVQF